MCTEERRPHAKAWKLLSSSFPQTKRDFSGTNYTKGNNKGSKRKSYSCPILRFDPQLDLPTEREERLISDQVISGLATRKLHCGKSFTSSVTQALKLVTQNWWEVYTLLKFL